MGRWCPDCRAEYVEGWGTCSVCGADLVAELPPEPPAALAEPVRRSSGDGEDPFVPIWEGPWAHGTAMARRLSDEAIPVDLGEAADAGVVRIEVPRSYTAEALGVLDGIGDGFLDTAPPGLDDPPHAADLSDHGMSAGVRLAIILVAAVLIVALIATSRY